nr:recombinase family protein [Mesorhizobium sp. dw_380]
MSNVLRTPAAQYVRMSTEHQRYSLENQVAAISEYAEARGFAVVQTYSDAGKSGLSLKGRDGLKNLLADVVTGQHAYSAILVLDVSRWGRFQDTDQSAHYEFLCRDAGVDVRYCGEPFENDGSMVSTIVKNLKRVMASEYSRELSAKVQRAQKQQARLGFKQGGNNIPYGLRRLLVTKDRVPRFLLGPGEHKGLSSDRVIFAPGPPEEIAIVRRIFRMFVYRQRSMSSIAAELNKAGILSTEGQPWSLRRVRTVLTSELMLGYYVYNRTTHTMMSPTRPNPPDQWIRTRVMEPLVSASLFAKAQRPRGYERAYPLSKSVMIKSLRWLLRQKKTLSWDIIDACPYTPCAKSYHQHFGDLRAAYAIVGFTCRWKRPRRPGFSDLELLDGIRRIQTSFGHVTAALINADPDLPLWGVFIRRFGSMTNAYGLAGFPITKSEACSSARKRAGRALRVSVQ